jgi:hypothetical protein
MSLDEKKLYWIPTRGTPKNRLYEYDIENNEVIFLKDLNYLVDRNHVERPPANVVEFSGDDIRDSKGRIYFTRHTYDNSGGAGILQIDVSERSGPAPVHSGGWQVSRPGLWAGIRVEPALKAFRAEFTLPKPGRVEHRVTDVAGRNVLDLGGGFYAAGRHEVYKQAGDLKSGTYVYHFKYNATVMRQKIVYIGKL